MKNSILLKGSALLFVSLVLVGCGRLNRSTESDGVFPASIGNFRRELVYKEKESKYLNEKNKDQNYKSRQAKYSDGTNEVFYSVGTHQKPEDAINEQAKEASAGNNLVWKTADLKDKSGKSIGKITVCRTSDDSKDSPNAANGGFNYSVAFNINNENHRVSVSNLYNNWKPETTDMFVAFVKGLPVAPQVDLSMLDLITTSFAGKGVTVDKLTAISPPVKLAPAPYLKGKTAVMVTGAFSDGVRTDEYIKESDQQANLMDEVGAIVKVECSKGPSIGQYVVKESNTKIPAFSSICKVAIIDKTIPAVIAQKTFTNSLMLDTTLVDVDKGGKVRDYNKEYVASAPTGEIIAFLQKLPRR